MTDYTHNDLWALDMSELEKIKQEKLDSLRTIENKKQELVAQILWFQNKIKQDED